jgi:hypothetical protein
MRNPEMFSIISAGCTVNLKTRDSLKIGAGDKTVLVDVVKLPD